MQRLQVAQIVLGLVLALAGFSSSGIATGGSSWDPIEVRSRLFRDPASAHDGRHVHLDTKATVARWTRRRITCAAYATPAPGTGPRAALISLVAFAQAQPPAFASVLNGGGSSDSCSTTFAPGTQCSAQNATNATCSVDSNSIVSFCSAASGTANMCSVLSSKSSFCSALASNLLCSTSTGQGGGSFTCSVSGGTGTCSTMSPNTGSSCTALSGNGANGNICSVTSGTGGASCTAANTAGNSGFCSVQSTGQPPDFCSVYGVQPNPPNTCTTIGTGGTATCSVAAGSSGACTVLVKLGPPIVFKVCVAQPPPP